MCYARPMASPAQRWALLAEHEAGALREGWGSLSEQSARERLATRWEVEAPAQAEEALAWLLGVGDRTDAAEALAALSEGAQPDDLGARLMADALERYRRTDLLAWDASRAITMARWCAAAGHLSSARAWSWAMDAARRMRAAYRSWDELEQGFVLGEAYFRGTWSTGSDLEAIQRREARLELGFEVDLTVFDPASLAEVPTPNRAPSPCDEEGQPSASRWGRWLKWVRTGRRDHS